MADLSLDDIIQGIVGAALWADLQWPEGHEKGEESGGGDSEYGIEDVTPESLAKLRVMAYAFTKANLRDIAEYVVACEDGVRIGYREGEGSPLDWLGHDIWLSACGHGAGFWDRGLGDLGTRLHEAAVSIFGRFEGAGLPYVTSDNKVSFIG